MLRTHTPSLLFLCHSLHWTDFYLKIQNDCLSSSHCILIPASKKEGLNIRETSPFKDTFWQLYIILPFESHWLELNHMAKSSHSRGWETVFISVGHLPSWKLDVLILVEVMLCYFQGYVIKGCIFHSVFFGCLLLGSSCHTVRQPLGEAVCKCSSWAPSWGSSQAAAATHRGVSEWVILPVISDLSHQVTANLQVLPPGAPGILEQG